MPFPYIPLGIVAESDRDILFKSISGISVRDHVSSYTSRSYVSEVWDLIWEKRLATKTEYVRGDYCLMDYLERFGGKEGDRELASQSTKFVYLDKKGIELEAKGYMEWYKGDDIEEDMEEDMECASLKTI